MCRCRELERVVVSSCLVFSALQPGQDEDEQMQRPEVREEDVTETRNRLGLTGPPKSKTVQVMEECGEDTHTHMFTDIEIGFDTCFMDESETVLRFLDLVKL